MSRLLTVLLCAFLAPSLSAGERPNTVPAVQEWHESSGTVPFRSLYIHWPDSAGEEEQELLQRFKQQIDAFGLRVRDKPSASSLEIFFDTNYQDINGHQDAYEIHLQKATVVKASSHQALLYATITFTQLFSQSRYRNSLPLGLIRDYPLYQKRMLLLDVARKFFTVSQVKDFIRIMAWLKMNELHLHLSDNSWGGYSAYRLDSAAYPELVAKDGHYSWTAISELQDFARAHGITITPEIDSPGHSLAFTNVRPDLKSPWLGANYLDISNPETYTFMEGILREVIPHFDAPDFHLGTDEYRLRSIEDPSLKAELGEAFRKYINHFNGVVREQGKVARIWSGYENMPGQTEVDKNVVIDMWETSDARDKSERGYQFINSSHFYTYIVPGAPYYGVDNQFVYENWTPETFSDQQVQNLEPGSPGLLGSKLHIWNDFGPSGYTVSEIARLSAPSMFTFSEKMWGTKAHSDYDTFRRKSQHVSAVPGTQILNRNSMKRKTIVARKRNFTLEAGSPIPIADGLDNLEYPWTVTMALQRKGEATTDEVLLSSRLATIYSSLEFTFDQDGEDVTKRGFAIVRANQTEGSTALESHRPQVIVFDYQLPMNQPAQIKLVGEQGTTSLFVNGHLVGTEDLQMLCPTTYLGSATSDVFQGTIRRIVIDQNAPE